MQTDELKIRQLTNQYLIRKGEKSAVVRDLCGFQAQFLSNALHSMRIRCSDFNSPSATDGMVKNWTIRGTVHIFSEGDLPLFIRRLHCDDDWSKSSWWNTRDDWELTPQRQTFLSKIILSALTDSPKTRDELKSICRERGMSVAEEANMFNPWGGGVREMCERGFMNYLVQENKTFAVAPSYVPMDNADAELELARRYFTNLAPATIHDAQYFFGTTAAQVKHLLAKLPVLSTECDGMTYFYINNSKTYNDDIPPCILLAGFDQLMLAYQKSENLFLPRENLRGIFNLSGIVMAAILLRGKVVGRWQKRDKRLALTLFENIGNDKRLIVDTAESLWTDIQRIEWVT